MKTNGWKWMAAFLLMVGGTAAMAQNTEVPGDNFSLEGALELFKKSQSPEEFEKMLNSEDSKVNNLDLNGDGYIDYIRVIDRNEGNVHTFAMQAIISDTETQDVAVIALEKNEDGKAVLQIIGDEDVYGTETIIEPTQQVRVNAGTSTASTTVNVWAWPAVQYVYSPSYAVWVSPWSWSVRPVWWSHWSPVAYSRYDAWWRPYRPFYAHAYQPRIGFAHRIYNEHRATSMIVQRRHGAQITSYRSTHGNTYGRGTEHNRGRYTTDVYNNRNNRQHEFRSNDGRSTMRTLPRGEGTFYQRERSGSSLGRGHTSQSGSRTFSQPSQRQGMSQPRMSGGHSRPSQPRMSSPDRGTSRPSGGHSGSGGGRRH